MDEIVSSSGKVSDAYLNTPEAKELSSHAYLPVQEAPLESDDLEKLYGGVAVLKERTNIESASLYVDTLMWTLLSSARGLTRDYRLMHDNGHGLNLATFRKWIVAQLAEGKQAVYWDGPESGSLNRNVLVPALCAISVTPPEKSEVVHLSFSKYIPEFTDIQQTKQEQAANAVATFPHDFITCSTKQRSLIPTRKEMFLASIQSFETLFQTMDRQLSLKFYQPALKFAAPCRARLGESLKEVLTEKQAKTSIDACILPVAPPSKIDTRLNGYSYVGFVGPGKKGVCFEMMDVKTGKWVCG